MPRAFRCLNQLRYFSIDSVLFHLTLDNFVRLILDYPMWNCSWNNFSNWVHVWTDCGGSIVNQVNTFFVRELGKYFILKSLFTTKSPSSLWYLATCPTVDSSTSLVNLVNFGSFQPLGNFVCKKKYGNGETYVFL